MSDPDLSAITQALYIKLGRRGVWEKLCLADGTIRLGYYEVPQHVPNKQTVVDLYKDDDAADVAASNHARQVWDFHTAGPETLWITFSSGYLWWAQASLDIEYLGADKAKFPNGSRLRRTLAGWSKCNFAGKPLIFSELSGKLTRSASYRQTICSIKGEAFSYLLNKIKGEDHPAVAEAKAAKATVLHSIRNLIALLTPQDFELFVDLLFTGSGWRRVSPLGGTQKTIDIELVAPLTNERAGVQIKSQTNQQELKTYLEDMGAMPLDRSFYVYHTADGVLDSEDSEVEIMGPGELAESALRAGLVDWLIEKVG